MKKSILQSSLRIKFICSVLLILPSTSFSQQFNFICNPSFKFYALDWVDNSRNKIYDSLNRINYSKVDFEVRIWTDCNGQVGMTHDVFIMRHFIKHKKWKGYYFKAFKQNSVHKNMTEYFQNAELKKYSNKNWKSYWDTLMSYNLLNIKIPSGNELEKQLNKNNPQYPDTFIMQLPNTDHDTYYLIELIKEDCKRNYSISSSILYMDEFNDFQEFKNLKKIISLMNSITK